MLLGNSACNARTPTPKQVQLKLPLPGQIVVDWANPAWLKYGRLRRTGEKSDLVSASSRFLTEILHDEVFMTLSETLRLHTLTKFDISRCVVPMHNALRISYLPYQPGNITKLFTSTIIFLYFPDHRATLSQLVGGRF